MGEGLGSSPPTRRKAHTQIKAFESRLGKLDLGTRTGTDVGPNLRLGYIGDPRMAFEVTEVHPAFSKQDLTLGNGPHSRSHKGNER